MEENVFSHGAPSVFFCFIVFQGFKRLNVQFRNYECPALYLQCPVLLSFLFRILCAAVKSWPYSLCKAAAKYEK